MRRTYMLISTLALVMLGGACGGAERAPAPANGNGANAANTAGTGNNSGTGSREGIGPRDTGIGGTSDGNTRQTVNGNSNVEPTGVNRNAGQGANANKP